MSLLFFKTNKKNLTKPAPTLIKHHSNWQAGSLRNGTSLTFSFVLGNWKIISNCERVQYLRVNKGKRVTLSRGPMALGQSFFSSTRWASTTPPWKISQGLARKRRGRWGRVNRSRSLHSNPFPLPLSFISTATKEEAERERASTELRR